jgi:hypothetical protein
MRRIGSADQYVISRESNVVRVNFAITPDPPTPQFPGAGALRNHHKSDDGAHGYRADRTVMPLQFGSKATVYPLVYGA